MWIIYFHLPKYTIYTWILSVTPLLQIQYWGFVVQLHNFFWCCKLQHEVPLNMHANKLHSSATVPANPPAVFSSQVLNTTTERPQSLHPYWVTNTKYHLLWYRSLSQTACRITEMLIILLAVFLHKHKRAHAKMFWGLISMSLWSGVAYPLEFCLLNHTHTHAGWHTNARTHASPAVVWKLVVAADLWLAVWLIPCCYCWRPATASLSGPWPVTSGWPSCALQPVKTSEPTMSLLEHI